MGFLKYAFLFAKGGEEKTIVVITLTLRRALEVPFSASALIQLANANSDLLMLAPSCNLIPLLRVAEARSDL